MQQLLLPVGRNHRIQLITLCLRQFDLATRWCTESSHGVDQAIHLIRIQRRPTSLDQVKLLGWVGIPVLDGDAVLRTRHIDHQVAAIT